MAFRFFLAGGPVSAARVEVFYSLRKLAAFDFMEGLRWLCRASMLLFRSSFSLFECSRKLGDFLARHGRPIPAGPSTPQRTSTHESRNGFLTRQKSNAKGNTASRDSAAYTVRIMRPVLRAVGQIELPVNQTAGTYVSLTTGRQQIVEVYAQTVTLIPTMRPSSSFQSSQIQALPFEATMC